jgi:hypothetical protein
MAEVPWMALPPSETDIGVGDDKAGRVAVAPGATVTGEGGTAIGIDSSAGLAGTALAHGAAAGGSGTVVGHGASCGSGVAVGRNASATDDGIAVGNGASASAGQCNIAAPVLLLDNPNAPAMGAILMRSQNGTLWYLTITDLGTIEVGEAE